MFTASTSLKVFDSENGGHLEDERASVTMEAGDYGAEVTVEGPDGTVYNLCIEPRTNGLTVVVTTTVKDAISIERNEEAGAIFGEALLDLLISEESAEAQNPVTGRLEQFVQP